MPDAPSLDIVIAASTELLRREVDRGQAALAKFEQQTGRTTGLIEDHISDLGRRFGPFAQQAQEAAEKVRASFSASFNSVKDLAQRALASGLKDGVVPDLGVERLREASAEAGRNAAAINLIVTAAERAAAAENDLTASTQRYIEAGRAAYLAEQQRAAALAQEAGALERLEIEIAQLTGAQVRQAAAGQRVVVSQGQQRAAMQQLSYQISDVATSFAGGINPMIIFAQQGSQVVQAISLMREESTGLVAFLSGPWGAVLLGATTVIGVLASKHISTGEAAISHKSAEDQLAEALAAVDAQTRRVTQSSTLEAQVRLVAASRIRQEALETRQLLAAKLELAKAQFQVDQSRSSTSAGTRGEVASLGLEQSSGRVAGLEAQLASNQRYIDALSKDINATAIKVVNQRAVQATDAVAAATHRFEVAQARLNVEYDRGLLTSGQYQAALQKEIGVRDAAIKAIGDAEKAASKAQRDADNAAKKAARERKKEIDDLNKAIEETIKIARNAAASLDKIEFVDPDKAAAEGARKFYSSIGIDPSRDFDAIASEAEKRVAAQQDASRDIFDNERRLQEGNIRSAANLMEDLFNNGVDSVWRNFKRQAFAVIAETVARFAIQNLTGGGGSLASAFSSAMGSQFGGYYADGGTPPMGKISIVGERGPELFVPKVPGTILPNGSFGGTSIVFSPVINAPGATAETVAMIRRELAAVAPDIVRVAQSETIKQLSRGRL